MNFRGVLASALASAALGCALPAGTYIEKEETTSDVTRLTPNAVMQSRMLKLQQDKDAYLKAAQDSAVENAKLRVQVQQQAGTINEYRTAVGFADGSGVTISSTATPQLLSTGETIVPPTAEAAPVDEGVMPPATATVEQISEFAPMEPPSEAAPTGLGLDTMAPPVAEIEGIPGMAPAPEDAPSVSPVEEPSPFAAPEPTPAAEAAPVSPFGAAAATTPAVETAPVSPFGTIETAPAADTAPVSPFGTLGTAPVITPAPEVSPFGTTTTGPAPVSPLGATAPAGEAASPFATPAAEISPAPVSPVGAATGPAFSATGEQGLGTSTMPPGAGVTPTAVPPIGIPPIGPAPAVAPIGTVTPALPTPSPLPGSPAGASTIVTPAVPAGPAMSLGTGGVPTATGPSLPPAAAGPAPGAPLPGQVQPMGSGTASGLQSVGTPAGSPAEAPPAAATPAP